MVVEAWCGDQHAAIKLSTRPDRDAALREEVQALAALARAAGEPAWLVPVLDVGEQDGRPFFVMPWYDQTLSHLLAAPLLVRLDLLVQLAEAVRRLHSVPGPLVWVHRDIKPRNLLVEPVGDRLRLRLADFGIVQEQERFAEHTNQAIGTPGYVPPERHLPLLREPDVSVDGFAVAAVVFEALSGRGAPTVASFPGGVFTEEAHELRRLMKAGDRGARYEELRRLSDDRLFRDDAAPLLEEEIAVLRNGLEDGLAEARLVGGARLPRSVTGSEADRLADRLVPVLQQALHPVSLRRQGDVGRLARVLRSVHDEVADRLGAPRWTPVPEAAPQRTRPVRMDRAVGPPAEASGGELRTTGEQHRQVLREAERDVPPSGGSGIAGASLFPWLWVGGVVLALAMLTMGLVSRVPVEVARVDDRAPLEAPVIPAPAEQETVVVIPAPRSPERPSLRPRAAEAAPASEAAPPAPTVVPERPEAEAAPPPQPDANPAGPTCVLLTAIAEDAQVQLRGIQPVRELRACDGDHLRVAWQVDGQQMHDERVLRLREGRWALEGDGQELAGAERLSLRWRDGRWRVASGR